jgi:hypothetical protein
VHEVRELRHPERPAAHVRDFADQFGPEKVRKLLWVSWHG